MIRFIISGHDKRNQHDKQCNRTPRVNAKKITEINFGFSVQAGSAIPRHYFTTPTAATTPVMNLVPQLPANWQGQAAAAATAAYMPSPLAQQSLMPSYYIPQTGKCIY